MIKTLKMSGKLASWFMVGAMMVTLVGCGKDVPVTSDNAPGTSVVEADVNTNVNGDVNADTDTDANAEADANTDADDNTVVETEVEPVVEPARIIYEGFTPGGTGYEHMITENYSVNGLCAKFVPIDKNEHAAFIGYVGNVIDNGGDYYGVKKSLYNPDDISIYTTAIENVQYAVYFEAPSDYFTGTPNVANEAIGGYNIKATSGSNYTDSITIKAFPMDYANGELVEYESYNTPADLYIERGYEDVKDLVLEKEDGRYTTITSRLAKDGNSRIFYGEFYDMSESKLVNMYSVKLQVPVDFSEEDALAIINSVRFMEKDEADELYMSLLKQTEANEYFDPATVVRFPETEQ